MSHYAIITYCRREDGHPGGVPKWAWHLKRALEEAGHEVAHFCWANFSRRTPELDAAPEWVKALALSQAVGERADDYERIVADGFWAAGLPDGARAVVCAHGLWAGYDDALGGVPREHIEMQADAFRRFPVVAVSAAVRDDLFVHHGVKAAAVVPNGIDLDAFRPDGHAPGNLVLYAGRGRAKGEDVVEAAARELGGEARVEYLGAAIGCEAPRFAAGDVFLHPSRYEGDAYACLEAAACGLPVVVSAVGRFLTEADVPGVVLPPHAPAPEWAAAVRKALRALPSGEPQRRAREWAERRADYRAFADAWRKVLGA
jgi:hypothetical protein